MQDFPAKILDAVNAVRQDDWFAWDDEKKIRFLEVAAGVAIPSVSLLAVDKWMHSRLESQDKIDKAFPEATVIRDIAIGKVCHSVEWCGFYSAMSGGRDGY